ncbi:hypothetical protein LGL55_00940 [Clostridium tagluense]|uniref:hypothetical protein n=1 Tax=Clostridium tagluense TaxID=360422 RepID=UPI001CF361E8|nr:hypothetical protein [Clostridium tagluense]MCB2309680.1 hypothetical protein [Clostridium tagluense]MCB2314790.1 hypothetical protein [Clostridium tagluense]MCB2319639.1 hypothetical protein [Clostridium tagluense]MCB2324274.1 hypothetical protein [Clostridium tagluense]MCB2329125.1 hypothetical protein [Clostridium tagluense]
MKIKVVWILFLSMCIIVCPSTTGAISMVKAVNMPEQQFIIAQGNLKIINAVSAVNHGGTGVITIQGRPNTQYNIKTSYKVGNKTVRVIQWRTTDKTGIATFNWIVGNDTAPGTYSATISGGGDILNINHTVLQY